MLDLMLTFSFMKKSKNIITLRIVYWTTRVI